MSRYTLINGYVGAKMAVFWIICTFFDKLCSKYIEPYAGGAGIFFGTYAGRYEKEVLNDANASLAFLYKSLSSGKYKEYVKDVLMSVEKPDEESLARVQFNEAKKIAEGICNYHFVMLKKEKMEIEEVCRLSRAVYITYSQSFDCAGTSYSRQKRNSKYINESARNIKNAFERIDKSKDMYVENVDALKIIKENIHKPEIQFYLDPPYVGQYRKTAKLYRNEMAKLYQHIELCNAIKNAKAAVVLSGYRSQQDGVPTIYDAILGDEWHCYRISNDYNCCKVVKKGEKRERAQEYIWTNRVPENAGRYCDLTDYKEKLSIDEYWKAIRKAWSEEKLTRKQKDDFDEAYKVLYGVKLFAKEEECA